MNRDQCSNNIQTVNITPKMMRSALHLRLIVAATLLGCLMVTFPRDTSAQITSLDNLRSPYRALRVGMLKFIGRSDTDWAYAWNLKHNKVQVPFPPNKPFFCDATSGPGARSPTVPRSVHRLRPGDIDVVGAIGDSLTAGNGALATNLLQVLVENKGVSWSIGGQANWRKYLTLPNMLKVFNPKLYGYSTGDGFSFQRSSKFNVADIGAMSRDIPYEAKVLAKRMSSDPNVDLKKHWKLITIMIGPNDFCYNICYLNNTSVTLSSHERDLVKTLRTLRDALPRTLVNLVIPPSMKVIVDMKGKPPDCEVNHHFECPCMFGHKFVRQRKEFYAAMELWQDAVTNVGRMDEFNDRDDFAVVVQPFLKHVVFPQTAHGNTDFTYMSLDCFHLSQKGYALATNALWNNMFEAPTAKKTNWQREFANVRCPTEQMPFIYTNKNQQLA